MQIENSKQNAWLVKIRESELQTQLKRSSWRRAEPPHPNVHLQMAYVEEGPLKLQGPLLADFSNDNSNLTFPCTRKERLPQELAKEQPVGLMALRLVQDEATGVCP